MNKYLSELIDCYSIYQLHQVKSKESLFVDSSKPPTLAEIDKFYPSPGLPEIEFQKQEEQSGYQLGKFTYPSGITSGFPKNDYATGLYCKTPSNKAVNVIVIHGWRMNNLPRIKNLTFDTFKEFGYNAFYFTLPYHSERTPEESLYSGEFMLSANIDRTLSAIRQAISDIRALIHWLRNNYEGKIVLMGISLGGLIVNLTSTLESQVDQLISVFYANSLADLVWNVSPCKYIKNDFQENNFTHEQLKKCWEIIEPSNFKPVASNNNILLMTAIYDQYILRRDADFLWESWGKPRRLLLPCGHSGIILKKKEIIAETIAFINGVT